jgi:hypothetical protein
MKTEHCTEMNNARSIEQKSGLKEPLQDRPNGFIVPAGILIGLGAGLLADYAVAGFLVGLGLGLLGAELLPLARKSRDGEHLPAAEANVTLLLIGAVLFLAGLSIVWAPAAVWIYAIPGLMILAGIGVLVRGFAKTS